MAELKLPSRIPAGTVLLEKYRIIRELGRGGMAAVYEAQQTTIGKRVALKILNAELSASTVVIERFFREARAASSVRSPYIVDIYDSGRIEDGRPFIGIPSRASTGGRLRSPAASGTPARRAWTVGRWVR